ncbi:MAG: hypothetical protein J3K34DRAFT_14575 [Monoraphidium minutum]|nr:MAG: hypothetical protein J3K34DRAFT_14575 [Monoraphidium minutum]
MGRRVAVRRRGRRRGGRGLGRRAGALPAAAAVAPRGRRALDAGHDNRQPGRRERQQRRRRRRRRRRGGARGAAGEQPRQRRDALSGIHQAAVWAAVAAEEAPPSNAWQASANEAETPAGRRAGAAETQPRAARRRRAWPRGARARCSPPPPRPLPPGLLFTHPPFLSH